MTSATAPTRPPRFSARWWITGKDGRVAIAEVPNAAILVWLASLALAWSNQLNAADETKVRHVGTGALIVWSLDELLRGASPFRRILGAIVLASQLVRLFG